MQWDLDNDRPIYLQLMERIQQDIVSGVYKAGDKLPSVRELAIDAAVNPNTMQKALSELERDGLLFSERTAGRFITGDSGLIRETRERMADELIQRFLIQMEQLGYSGDEVQERLARRSAPESGEG